MKQTFLVTLLPNGDFLPKIVKIVQSKTKSVMTSLKFDDAISLVKLTSLKFDDAISLVKLTSLKFNDAISLGKLTSLKFDDAISLVKLTSLNSLYTVQVVDVVPP